jgi:hypothetical protein
VTLNRLSPAEFGKLHRQMFEGIVGPLAQGIGAKSLSSKLHMEAYSRHNREPDVALVFDNIKDIEETNKGSLPLKKAYDADEALATSMAAAAAAATGGALTPESARFLPHQLKADYERITGLKIDDKPGTSVSGVTIKARAGNSVDVKIDFEKALKGATAKDVVLALTDNLVIGASRLDGGVQDPSIPPYWIVIYPRADKIKPNTQLKDDSGSRSFNDADHGQLVRAGTKTIKLEDGYNATRAYQTVTFTLDKVNDYGDASVKPASQATKAVRDGWNKFFKKSEGYFDLSKGVAAGKLEQLTLAQARELPGAKTLFSAIRANAGESITRQVERGTLEFVKDPATNSVAVLRSVEGESEHWLSVLDLSKKKWVGTFSVGDDGTKDWTER